MAFDPTKLNSALLAMKDLYSTNPEVAVRGQGFIKKLHEYCADGLRSRGLERADLKIISEAQVLTSHKYKDTDVALVHPTSGPLLIISVRSQMSSLSKNFINYYEMEIGDVYGIHERFPLCVTGLVYLHPTQSILPGSEKQNFNFDRAEKMFNLITGREKGDDAYGHYEEIAYLKVDFHKDPPAIVTDFPKNRNLHIEDFFDKLYQKFVDRNFNLL